MRSPHASTNILHSDIADKVFDYVIAGGGTAGLTLASRLSEDSTLSVVVIEAGSANIDDPNITVPGQFGKQLGDPKYDWSFKTEKQHYSNDRSYIWSRGKGLGGSSGINFHVWSKPPAADIDALEQLGNPGWNWDEYARYSKRSETFHEPTEEQLAIYPLTFDPENRGVKGPIQTCFPRLVPTIDKPFQRTMLNMGLRAVADPCGGDITGTWIGTASLDPKTQTRSYATTAHYIPKKQRSNYTVLTEATVTQILFEDINFPNENLTATGLEFVSTLDPSQVNVVYARREVILCAGAIKDPQLLELSGIGRREVLERLGLNVKNELPGVGENVQEHTLLSTAFELSDDVEHETFDLMRDPAYAAEQWRLHSELKGMHTVGDTSFAYFPLSLASPTRSASLIAKIGQDIKEKKASGNLPPGLAEQLDIQFMTLKDDALPDLEIIEFPGYFTTISTPEPGKRYVTIMIVLNHPLSRGTIHAASRNPMHQPEIDPHYFESDFGGAASTIQLIDLELLVQNIKFVKSMANVEPWKSTITREIDPGPNCTTDEEIRDYIKNTNQTCWHTIGSCSMLPRDKQGVVDPELKVYGTNNLRIADLSVIPLHFAAHTQATAYVIGEKAADIIRKCA